MKNRISILAIHLTTIFSLLTALVFTAISAQPARALLNDNTASTIQQYALSIAGKYPVSADFDGDGLDDAAIFNPSNATWYIRNQGQYVFGAKGDIPVAADYNGDGKAEIAVFRPSNHMWYTTGAGKVSLGLTGDIPVPADYNGDGKTEKAVFRPSNGTWYIGKSKVVFGQNGDIPLPADYNGDGKADKAFYRPSNHKWYIQGKTAVTIGKAGDIPVPADYNGDGKIDMAIFRPASGLWSIRGVGNFTHGQKGDLPLPMDYQSVSQSLAVVVRAEGSVLTWFVRGVGSFEFSGPAAPTTGSIPAFPGAEGFGSKTVAGRGGKVIEVTNLNDSGAGSLRAAIDAKGSRVVVFRVAGMINLKSTLLIDDPYITVAGQTAPGGGITLRPIQANVDPLIEIDTHDVVVRYLTLRAGPPAAGDAMNISTNDAHTTYNVVVDHNSMSWGVDQVFATWYDVHEISIQWNIFSEALDCSLHPKGCHSKGPMLGSYASDESKNKPGAKNISFHHNLMAHNGERNPLVKTAGVCDVVNNVVYNPFGSFSHVDMEHQLVIIPANYVGNYFKPGADTSSGKYGVDIANEESIGAQIYVKGNIGTRRPDDTLPEIDIVDPDARPYVVSTPHPADPVTATSAITAYNEVLANAGAAVGLSCDGSFFPRRDTIDIRIINDVKNGTGKVIDDPSQVGGWIIPASGTACADSDHDGMPDAWEKAHGFNPNVADGTGDKDGDGYTNLEEFLNGTDPG